MVKSTHDVPKNITKEVRSENKILVSFHFFNVFFSFGFNSCKIFSICFALIHLILVYTLFIIFLASARPSSSLMEFVTNDSRLVNFIFEMNDENEWMRNLLLYCGMKSTIECIHWLRLLD